MALLFLIGGPLGYAEWEPDYLISRGLISGERRKDLESKSYKVMKDYMLYYSKGGGCSPKKVELLMDLIVLERPTTCVEIGVYEGYTLIPIVAALMYLHQGSMVYAIDPWSNEEAVRWLTKESADRSLWASVNFDAIYRAFLQKLEDIYGNAYCRVLRYTSEAAAERIGSIDFLHLDGNLGAEGAIAEVALYLPKVRKGGYILMSNILHTIGEEHPRLKAFSMVLGDCQIVCGVDSSNSVLLRKL